MPLELSNKLSRFFATRLSRRATLAAGATGLAGLGLHRTAAQASAPVARPAASPVADAPGFGQDFLFVQTAEAGTWAPKAGEAGVYTLTLTGAAAQTIYFSDRPERIVGTVPMQPFLDGLGFTPDNPPNAALVTGTGDDEDVLVMELRNPVYDAGVDTLTYEAVVLERYEGAGLAFAAERQEDAELPEQFGTTSLFIDDCPDITDCHYFVNSPDGQPARLSAGPVPGEPIGRCYHPGEARCLPCNGQSLDYYDNLCNSTYPKKCNGLCFVSVG